VTTLILSTNGYTLDTIHAYFLFHATYTSDAILDSTVDEEAAESQSSFLLNVED
jgi:hypothetical protein